MKYSRILIDGVLILLLVGILILPIGSVSLLRPQIGKPLDNVLSTQHKRDLTPKEGYVEHTRESTESTKIPKPQMESDK